MVICAFRRFYEASAPQTTPKRPNNEWMLLPVVNQGGDEYIDVLEKNIILVIIVFFCFVIYTAATAVSPLLVPKNTCFYNVFGHVFETVPTPIFSRLPHV